MFFGSNAFIIHIDILTNTSTNIYGIKHILTNKSRLHSDASGMFCASISHVGTVKAIVQSMGSTHFVISIIAAGSSANV